MNSKYIFFILLTFQCIFGCGKEASKSKVFLLAVDGLTWSVLKDGIKQGKLKNFSFIVNNGAFGSLRSIPPTASPVIWTSIATGKKRDQHGVRWFLMPGENGKKVVASSDHRKVKAIWNILSERKKKVGVIGYYVTWPVEEVNGVMVSERTFFPIEGGAYPASINEKIKEVLSKYSIEDMEKVKKVFYDGEWGKRREMLEKYGPEFWNFIDKSGENLNELIDDFPVLLSQKKWKKLLNDYSFIGTTLYYFLLDKFRFSLTERIFNKDYDFFTLYLKGIDVVSHDTWKYYEKLKPFPVSAEDRRFFKNIIPNYYAYVDKVIGAILKKMGKDTVLILVSDHGFMKMEHKALLCDINKLLNKMGFLDYDDKNNVKHNKIYDNTLFWLNFYDTREIVINLKNLSPTKSKDIVSNVTNRLRKITVGKESFFDSFIIKKKTDAVCILEVRINKKFFLPQYAIENPNLSKKVIVGEKIFSQSDFFSFSPLSGTHKLDGVFIAYGNKIKKHFTIKGINVLDITPTILKTMGLPLAQDMEGEAASSIFDNHSWLFSQKTIPSYETGKRKIRKIKTSEADKTIKNKLRSLGYIQ